MRLIITIAFIWILGYAEAQSPVVSAEQMNVFYVGLENPIKVAIPGVPFHKTVVKISEGTLVKTDSDFHVLIPERRVNECLVGVGKIKKGDTIWLYTKKFKVRNVPRPELMIGPFDMQSKSRLSIFRAQTTLAAVLENFVYDGVKFTIVSYKAHFIDPISGYHSIKVEGNSTAPIQGLSSKLSPAGVIIFDSVLVKGLRTIYLSPAACRFEESDNFQFNLVTNDSIKTNILGNLSCLRNLPENYKITCSSATSFSSQKWTHGMMTEHEIYRVNRKYHFKINGKNATIISDGDSAVGQMEFIDNVMDTGLSIKKNLHRYADTSKYTYECLNPDDTIQYLYATFKELKNLYLPGGNWEFFRNGRIKAEGIVRLASLTEFNEYERTGWYDNFPYPVCKNLVIGEREFTRDIDAERFSVTNIFYYLAPGYNFKLYK